MSTPTALLPQNPHVFRGLYGPRALSEKDQHLIALVAQGLKNRDVATALGTTEFVVKNYLRRIYDKIGVWNRLELALWYEARRAQARAGTA